jgi:hypothetical protein
VSMTDWFHQWVGWGWGLAGIVWLAGSAFILMVVDARFPSRIATAVVFVVWTLAVLALASYLFGFRPPLAR